MLCFLRRAIARFTDYLLWGMLTVAVLGDKTGDLRSPSLPFYLSFCLYPFIEALLVSKFATTFGKRLTGVFISDQDGNKLSYPASLKRSFLVFGTGMGFFLPYISLILPLYAAVRIRRNKTVFWDGAVPDRVDYVKTTRLDKALFAGFFLFLGTGFFLTARTAWLYQEPDFSALEENILGTYFEEIRPQIIRTLSAETVLTPQAAGQASAKLEEIQSAILFQKKILFQFNRDMKKRINRIPDGELKMIRKKQLNDFFLRLDSFLFSERMRLSLFENILAHFKSAEKNKFDLIDDRPVFKNEEMQRQYDNYMTQLQTFLSLDLPEED